MSQAHGLSRLRRSLGGAMASLALLCSCTDAGPLPPTNVFQPVTWRVTADHSRLVGEKANISLSPDGGLRITSRGRSLEIRGRYGIIDGKQRVVLDESAAAFTAMATRELQARQAPDAQRLLKVARDCHDREIALAKAVGDNRGGLSNAQDPCHRLGMAFWTVSEAIRNFWDNALSNIAFDVFKSVALGAVTLQPEWPVLSLVADIGTALVELGILHNRRDILAGQMREAGCV